MSKAQKGNRTERELVNKLYNRGFSVNRAPSSGSATDRSLPDVDAGGMEVSYAIEGKSSSGGPVYIPGNEVEDLFEYASRSAMRVRIGIRYDNKKWKFLHPAELEFTTRGGNYKITEELAKEKGQTIDDLVEGIPCKPRNIKSA